MHAEQVATTAAIGAGFEFTPEQIETQLTQCQELSFQYRDALKNAERAETAVHEPAPDQAGSVLQANQTKQSLSNLQDVIRSQINFLTHWQNTLTQVKANYLQNEHLTEGQWQGLAQWS
ncbi:MAG TPA: hypothetical protein VEO01_35470 [Pseudonocardiaceae bacterium]|nr:hypothetical protein [Pseudonocardiaceae bacterium]